jgi:tellurite resistance protein TehA-like permease
MPVVPPMVPAARGALLVPYAPAGQPRLTLLSALLRYVRISLVASLIMIVLIWGRLMGQGIGSARLVPTLWIILGPLGQSVTAVSLLGKLARDAPAPEAAGLHLFGLVYGVPVWGFALLRAALAATVTIRIARRHLPFSLTRRSFLRAAPPASFPVADGSAT